MGKITEVQCKEFIQ
jgi:uncharacterized HAD superfamily protein